MAFTLKPAAGVDLSRDPRWVRPDRKVAPAQSTPEQATLERVREIRRTFEQATASAPKPATPAPPSVKAVDCGRCHAHPAPLSDRELTDQAREAERLGLATIASELKLLVGVNWYSRWDGARVSGKRVEGFTCPCTPDRVWVQDGMSFWSLVDTIVHEGRHLDQTERGVTLTREEREADARQWASKTVEFLKASGF
jgi:hypothetical protein